MKPLATLSLLAVFAVLTSTTAARADEPSDPAARANETAVRPSAEPPPRKPGLGYFAGMEWRGMYLPGKLAHGPAVEVGLILFNGHLKVGIGATTRPGPINPATFDVDAVDGQTYRGKTRLRLRSDGATVGLVIAPVFDLPGTSTVAVELPVLIGQGAYGFYLTGDDRKTPDGRRVSAWENQLLGGKDSSLGLGLDVGVRFAWKPRTTPWMRPYIGGHYTTVIGFDTLAKASYAGPSVALGVQFGRF